MRIILNKRNFTILAILFLVAWSLNAVQAQTSRENENPNVLDYYKLAISHDFESKITIKDLKNGYLEIVHEDYKTEVGLFRTSNGGALLLAAYHYCYEACYTELSAWAPYVNRSNLDMRLATDDVLPRLSERENLEIFNTKKSKNEKHADEVFLIYQIPRGGKIIEVKGSGTGKNYVKLYELHLKDDMFVIIRE